jgi:adenylate cyclase
MNDVPRGTPARTTEPSGWRQISGPLFRKYVGLFLAVVCIALVTNGVLEIWFSYREHRTNLIRIQSEQAQGAAAKISQFIREIESQVGWTTQLPWSSSTIEQRQFDIQRLLRQVPAITELTQVDPGGREQLRVSRIAIDVIGSQADRSRDPNFTAAVLTKVHYGPVYFRRGSEPYMTLALAGTRRDAGVSIADVNLKLIWDVVQAIKVGERGQAYVVGTEGRLIAHPDISLVLRNTDMTALPHVRAARQPGDVAADPTQESTDIRGRRVLTAHAPVLPLNWLVFVELPFDEAYKPLLDSIKRSGVVLLAGLALALLAGVLLAQRMVVPIQAIRRGAARIGAGDLSQRISVKTGDEIETLADQFNDMAGKLEESYADLERKVELRTQQLAQSVAELRALGEVSQEVNSTLDLATVLNTIVTKAVELTDTDAGAIYVRDSQRDQPQLRSSHRMSAELIAALQEPRIGRDPASTGSGDRAPRQIADLRNEPTTPAIDVLLHAGYRAVLVVPLIRIEEVVGALVMWRKEAGAFSNRVVELLQTFGTQSVLAIQNARLHDQVAAQASDLATWNRTLEQRVDDQLLEIERMGRLRRFLSPQVAQAVLATGDDSVLESHRRAVTVLFCDVRGFTAFSETAQPEEVMALLREYHAVLGALIHQFEGTVERFAGDAIMVIFNDPLPCPDPSLRAVRMAIEMRRQVSALMTKWRRLGHELGFGVGIAHGYATLGRIGFEGRYDYGAVGSVVNLAARLCADARDEQILIDSRVFAAIEQTIGTEPAGELSLKGFGRPVRAFNVCSAQVDVR